MQKNIVQMILVVMSVVGVAGCAERSHQLPQGEKSIRDLSAPPRHIYDLVGVWEYEDKSGSYLIRLNEKGKGSYDWEEGWFETHELKDGVWKGTWFQTGNDREGGFELKYSKDSPMAQGYWWYTRIGPDRNPLEPGGTFTMQRIPYPLIGGK